MRVDDRDFPFPEGVGRITAVEAQSLFEAPPVVIDSGLRSFLIFGQRTPSFFGQHPLELVIHVQWVLFDQFFEGAFRFFEVVFGRFQITGFLEDLGRVTLEMDNLHREIVR